MQHIEKPLCSECDRQLRRCDECSCLSCGDCEGARDGDGNVRCGDCIPAEELHPLAFAVKVAIRVEVSA